MIERDVRRRTVLKTITGTIVGGGAIGKFAGLAAASPEAELIYAPENPSTGDSVVFDAGGSRGEIVEYEWSFGDGNTASGLQVRNAFEEPGEYNVRLIVTDEDGDFDDDRETVVVEEAEEETQTPVEETPTPTEETPTPTEETPTPTEETSISTEGTQTPTEDTPEGVSETDNNEQDDDVILEIPGFGIVTTLGGIVGGGYVMWRRAVNQDSVNP